MPLRTRQPTSSGLEIKPVSTARKGYPGTSKHETRLFHPLTMEPGPRPKGIHHSPPSQRLWLRVPVMAISMSTWASTGSRSARLTAPTPPIKSDWFSLAASQRALSLVAPRWEGHERAPRGRGSQGISVNGNEEIRAEIPSPGRATAERHVIIARANEFSTKARVASNFFFRR